MKQKKVYLSGPISGCQRWEYMRRFGQTERRMKSKNPGTEVVNPCKVLVCKYEWVYKLLQRILGKDGAYWIVLFYDLWLLRGCTHIYMMDGWEMSRGAMIENYVACLLGLKYVPRDMTIKE